MISATIVGIPAAQEALQRKGALVIRGMAQLLRRMSISLEAAIKDNLSNRVLHIRSGTLMRSVHHAEPEYSTNAIRARVFIGPEAPYGRVHEFGLTVNVPAHDRLRGFVEGMAGFKFVEHVRAYTATYPERSFMREPLPRYREPLVVQTTALLRRIMGGQLA